MKIEIPEKRPRILVWDLETDGVNALKADLGFVMCFGYKWSGIGEAKCMTVLDHPGRRIRDDAPLLRAAYPYLCAADLLVAHYGDRFDRKFFESRLLKARLAPLPITRQVDTCLIARARLKLSSNRLANLAKFLGVKTPKMDKGNGWPDWWMDAMAGHKPSIRSMAKYCAQDVQCLDECLDVMRPIIPSKYMVNATIGLDRPGCKSCGGLVTYKGTYFSEKKAYRRYQCRECGKWGRDDKAMA